MSYRDRTFCPKSDKDNPKCLSCYRFFDKEEYNRVCDEIGYEIPVLWFLEPPCGDKDTENFVVKLKQESEES